MTSPLHNSVRVAAELREKLINEFRLTEDDEALDDTILGECDLDERLGRIAREAIQAEAFASGLSALIKTQQSRKARLEAKAERLREIVEWAMSEAGIKKIPLPDMTLAMTPGRPPLIVKDGEDIPDLYLRFPDPEPDKKAIREALQLGERLSFAELGNAAPTLTIRKS